MYIINIKTKKWTQKKLLFVEELLLLNCGGMNSKTFAAFVLYSVTESIVRLRVLKFSAAAASIALTVSWLLILTALTMFSVISFDRFTNSLVYGGVTTGKRFRYLQAPFELKPYF